MQYRFSKGILIYIDVILFLALSNKLKCIYNVLVRLLPSKYVHYFNDLDTVNIKSYYL